ncbi:MAG: NADH-quinone oxidoreductase subunit M, partial [Magnetococcales bacterium]|nr:NADH-quinone oxidoreductase subunit M [Magnetococcales bacterium]
MAALSAPLASLPLLSLLIGLPLVGALLLGLLPARQARSFALGVGLVEAVLACGVVWGINPEQAGFQWLEQGRWIPTLHLQYLLGVDGLSALFLPLSALLFVGLVLASTGVQRLPQLYFALLLALEGITIGIFSALDLLLFFLFWELTLIPLYFLVSLWGIGPQRRFAATQYTLWMLGGGVLLLFGFLLVATGHGDWPAATDGFRAPAALLFDLPTLLATPLPVERQWPVFLLLLMGFAVKTPVVPLHIWLPTVAMEGPVVVVAMMTGLKLGAYGLIRFALPLAPQVAQEWYGVLAGWGVGGIFYGGLLALVQSNLRRLLAFASISHVGFVLLGLSTFTVQGVQGALLQLLNFTLIAS